MSTINLVRLHEEIAKKNLTVSSLAESVGVHRSTLCRKLKNGGISLNLGEIWAINKRLRLDNKAIEEIYLS